MKDLAKLSKSDIQAAQTVKYALQSALYYCDPCFVHTHTQALRQHTTFHLDAYLLNVKVKAEREGKTVPQTSVTPPHLSWFIFFSSYCAQSSCWIKHSLMCVCAGT